MRKCFRFHSRRISCTRPIVFKCGGNCDRKLRQTKTLRVPIPISLSLTFRLSYRSPKLHGLKLMTMYTLTISSINRSQGAIPSRWIKKEGLVHVLEARVKKKHWLQNEGPNSPRRNYADSLSFGRCFQPRRVKNLTFGHFGRRNFTWTSHLPRKILWSIISWGRARPLWARGRRAWRCVRRSDCSSGAGSRRVHRPCSRRPCECRRGRRSRRSLRPCPDRQQIGRALLRGTASSGSTGSRPARPRGCRRTSGTRTPCSCCYPLRLGTSPISAAWICTCCWCR